MLKQWYGNIIHFGEARTNTWNQKRKTPRKAVLQNKEYIFYWLTETKKAQ